MFVDAVKVYARAGHGGRGSTAFHREAFRPKGGPSGGNGGAGGDVILEADHDLNNLIQQFYQPRLLAEDGRNGMGKGMDGRAGEDLIIKVPCGTLVWRVTQSTALEPEGAAVDLSNDSDDTSDEDAPEATGQPVRIRSSIAERPVVRSGERAIELDLSKEEDPYLHSKGEGASRPPDASELVCDLTEHGQRFVLCKGGRGGLGNRNFATAVRQAPRFAQPGESGGEGEFRFELRLMADVGLVGYPNAGKSTLLTSISHARPRIAAYPFTTLTPQVGIVEYEDYFRLVVCDVPGIIEGAHQNVGLGHAFLRHIERCRVLVILVDMAGTDGRAPWEDYRHLLSELEQYDPALLDRPRLVVANKMDEPAAAENLRRFKRKVTKTPVIPISAAFDDGITAFRKAIREAVEAESK